MNWTHAELIAYEARRKTLDVKPVDGASEDEGELHQQIVDYCRSKNWLCFRGSMAHRTYRTPGEPDFIIVADGPRFFLVEAKTRTGKLSDVQLGIKAWAEKLGTTVSVVRSLQEFREVTK